MINLNNVKQILVFDNPYDLFVECDYAERLTNDQKDFFSRVWDYDSFRAYLINFEYVMICDSITGDVISWQTVIAFWNNSRDYYNEYEAGNN